MFNVRVEYDSRPIRHIAVQCPNCNNWFNGWDIVRNSPRYDPFEVLRYDYHINFAEFDCPICGEAFGWLEKRSIPHIEESSYPEIYDGVLTKKEVWGQNRGNYDNK